MDSRRRLIRHLISVGGVSSQAELQEHLAGEGFKVTQATISRDLAAIGATKTEPGGAYQLGEPNQSDLELDNALNSFAISIDASANLVVIKTQPSAAGVVAGAIDRAGLESVMGTVAGDDTVLVISVDARGGAKLAKALDPAT